MVQPTSPARGPRKFNQRVRFVFKIIVCKSSADVQPMISQYSANNHHDFSQPFQACLSTDISANATWMATIRTEPRAQILPPLSDTVGWSFLSYLYDLLHGLWLGIGRDAVGACGAWVLDLIELSEDDVEKSFRRVVRLLPAPWTFAWPRWSQLSRLWHCGQLFLPPFCAESVLLQNICLFPRREVASRTRAGASGCVRMALMRVPTHLRQCRQFSV
jgi:hypothetical protein